MIWWVIYTIGYMGLSVTGFFDEVSKGRSGLFLGCIAAKDFFFFSILIAFLNSYSFTPFSFAAVLVFFIAVLLEVYECYKDLKDAVRDKAISWAIFAGTTYLILMAPFAYAAFQVLTDSL